MTEQLIYCYPVLLRKSGESARATHLSKACAQRSGPSSGYTAMHAAALMVTVSESVTVTSSRAPDGPTSPSKRSDRSIHSPSKCQTVHGLQQYHFMDWFTLIVQKVGADYRELCTDPDLELPKTK